MDAAELRQMQATYYGLLAEADHHLGRVIDHLEATGQLDETLVVVTSDHGELLGDRWLFGKEGFFDRAFHVPLLIRAADAPAGAWGSEVHAFTEAVDLMPTILDWLGGEVPHTCDGRSLAPWLRGERPSDWRSQAHFEFDFRDPAGRRAETHLGLAPDQCCLAVLRGERYKYVHFPALPPLLFDLESDPDEVHDLSGDPAYAGVLRDCLHALLSWRMTHADRTLANTRLTGRGPVTYRGPRTAAPEDAASEAAQ
jgi:arylsulfatase A-like enzyme